MTVYTSLAVWHIPRKAAGISRLGDLWTPQRQQAIALGVSILKRSTLPFFTTTSMSALTYATVRVNQ